AQELGHHPEVILAGRRINDGMAKHIASSIIKKMLKKGFSVVGANINVLGLTFKENTPDLRNTKITDVIKELQDFGLNVIVNDVEADVKEAKNFYNLDLKNADELNTEDVLVFAVPHEDYLVNKERYLELVSDNGLIFDIKGIISDDDLKENQSIWRL